MKKIILCVVAILSTFTVLAIKVPNQHRFLNHLIPQFKTENSLHHFKLSRDQFQNQKYYQLQFLKNSSLLKQRLDSVVYPGNTKEEYNYDTSGRNIRYTFFEWKNNSWENSEKSEYVFDSNGYVIQENMYYWDESQWIYYYKLDYAYNTGGKLISETISTSLSI